MPTVAPIDWAKVGVPQGDGYDSTAILAALCVGRYAGKEVVPAAGERLWLPGRAKLISDVAPHQMPSDEYRILPPDDAIVLAGLRMLDLWPAVRDQCGAVLHALCPMTMVSRASIRGQGHGCSCGHFGDCFGWIYVTADDPWGFAEGVVHEMAHWKLRALGVWFEDWTALLLENRFDELYASPVRKDKPRPMGAVLHAQYSYIHVARMTSLMLQAKERPDAQDIDWAALQLHRITEGQGTLREHARGTLGVGKPFLEGIDAWTTEVLTDGHVIVAAAKSRMVA